MLNYDVVVIGGGPAGLAAAIGAHDNGAKTLILERDERLGGILNQCIHNGFGLHTFKEELSGPEYAQRFIDQVEEKGVEYKLNATVLNISKDRTITYINPQEGLVTIQAKAVVLAMGCRERSRGALNTPGYRPAGIFSAGTAQKMINIEGYLPGKEVVILGSGDIGLIMARRMTLEGAHVQLVAEIMPFSSGLKRNIVQCLEDFNIPLQLSHTVVDIKGKERVEAVVIAEVDEKSRPIPGTEVEYKCDTLLLSVGLIPENELSRGLDIRFNPGTNGAVVDESMMTSAEGIFACGNVLHVHDLVDNVSAESAVAGAKAALYAQGKLAKSEKRITVKTGNGVRYTVPSYINPDNVDTAVTVRFRVTKPLYNCKLCVSFDEKTALSMKKKVMIASEMQVLNLSRKLFEMYPDTREITVFVQEDGE
ncbi:MAG: FAD-dependent oxidoreductase [Erysipelotrichaceae bacterium]|nr:FAD-dependent oxidoreductase [Erysipelotrichaceae bacterium]